MKWKDKINKVNQQDCLELMKEMPDNCVDLTVTSPPYDNLREYKGYEFNFKCTAQELYRITKEGAVVVWVVGDATIKGSETGSSFRQALYLKEVGFNLHDTMIYEKNSSPFPDKTRYYQVFEYMFVLSKGKPKTFNQIQDRKNRWTKSFGKSSNRQKDGKIKQKKEIKVKEFGSRFNIWKYNTGFGYSSKCELAFEHPAIFPEQLAKDHVTSWSNKDDLIFDPFMGSWTTALACKQLGRNFIGAEISEDYCKIGEQRLRQQILI